MLGVVDEFSQDVAARAAALPRRGLRPSLILAAACNAAMLGVSRLGYSLALNRQIPSRVGYLHPRTATPVVIIGIGAVLAILLLLTADLEFLLGISAFGATLAFTIVLPVGLPPALARARPRPPVPDAVQRARAAAATLPLPAALGALLSGAAFAAVLAFHGGARWVGLGWMAFGVLVYVYYRLSEDKPLLKRITVPEKVAHPQARRGRVRLDPRAGPRDAARRRHRPDRGAARRRGGRRRSARAAR